MNRPKRIGESDHRERVDAALKAAEEAGLLRVALGAAAQQCSNPGVAELIRELAERGRTHTRTVGEQA
jgi:hypothetical protein